MRMMRKLMLSLALSMAVCAASWASADQKFHITVLSGRPEMVTGGDVLVEIEAPADADLNQVTVKLNGQDVSKDLHRDSARHVLTGLVTGLKQGENSLDVFSDHNASVRPAEHLTLKNHAITGPVFSGPQEQPFVCQTEDFRLPDGNLLGPALDANCSVKTVVTYVFKTTQTSLPADQIMGGMKPLLDLRKLPPDVAWTTTTTGKKVPYVVRVETGTINRAIYQLAVLHDPTTEPAPGPQSQPAAWNGRLLYSFGAGCVTGWNRQGTSIGYAGTVFSDPDTVGKGYAEASSTLNVFSNNCNDLISAETMMMVKERFIKAYGRPAFTFSRGGSGGSYQQLQIADNYPGLLDGIVVGATFPDINTTSQYLSDAKLLNDYFNKKGERLSEDQRRAIAGVAQSKNLAEGSIEAGRIDPIAYCPRQVASALRYDPVKNRAGVRCDVYDHAVNVYGRNPATGFARRPLDNTGVQYGLLALNAGKITTSQFLDLNQSIGGLDDDANIVPNRTVADLVALRAAYRTGRVTNGELGLAQVPIIDVRTLIPGGDLAPNGDHHLKFFSFALRERLKRNGTLANEVLLVGSSTTSSMVTGYALSKMDEWLTNLANDPSSDSAINKIARAKPTDLQDSCYTQRGERIVEPQTFSGGQCNSLYPAFPSPRMAAGGPLTNDVLKCQLKPIDFNDYKASFTEPEKKKLAEIFPNGTCDWNKPGVEQRPPETWLSY